MNVLTLVEEVFVSTLQDGRYVREPESHFLDYVVDGVSLRTRAPYSADMVTNLNRAWPTELVDEAVEVLLGMRAHPSLAAGRIPLLVCPACGDLDCGALTAHLTVSDGEVGWSDWRWVDHNGERDTGPQLVHYTFERVAYETAIRGAAERVAQMPYDKLAHQGKRFLWPWEWEWKLPPRPS